MRVLDDLEIPPYATVDEVLGERLGPGRPPKASDAELVCLAVARPAPRRSGKHALVDRHA